MGDPGQQQSSPRPYSSFPTSPGPPGVPRPQICPRQGWREDTGKSTPIPGPDAGNALEHINCDSHSMGRTTRGSDPAGDWERQILTHPLEDDPGGCRTGVGVPAWSSAKPLAPSLSPWHLMEHLQPGWDRCSLLGTPGRGPGPGRGGNGATSWGGRHCWGSPGPSAVQQLSMTWMEQWGVPSVGSGRTHGWLGCGAAEGRKAVQRDQGRLD